MRQHADVVSGSQRRLTRKGKVDEHILDILRVQAFTILAELQHRGAFKNLKSFLLGSYPSIARGILSTVILSMALKQTKIQLIAEKSLNEWDKLDYPLGSEELGRELVQKICEWI